MVDCEGTGDPVFQHFVAQLEGGELVSPQTLQPATPAPRESRRFIGLRELLPEKQFAESRLQRSLLEPADMVDAVRLLVYHGGVFVGWIGAFRAAHRPRFGRVDSRRLRALVPLARDALVAAHQVERRPLDDGETYLLSDASGRIWMSGGGWRGS